MLIQKNRSISTEGDDNLPKVKSPLRYPGGKSRAVKIIWKFIPKSTKELCSPFFGGGSFEIFCAQKGIRVYGYDNFRPLVDFWQYLLTDPNLLATEVKRHLPLTKTKFYEFQKILPESKSKLERATLFFVLNRTSYSGAALCGGMAKEGEDTNPRFKKSSIDRLRNFRVKNLSVKIASFEKSIAKHRETLLYLDPPYFVESKLYGKRGDLHKNFDHDGLAKILKRRNKWILSYNYCDEMLELYGNYVIDYEQPKWKYGMSNNKLSREALIFSHDIAKLNNLE
jgi:DNA adenine methylase